TSAPPDQPGAEPARFLRTSTPQTRSPPVPPVPPPVVDVLLTTAQEALAVREDDARPEVGEHRRQPADDRGARRVEAPADCDPDPDQQSGDELRHRARPPHARPPRARRAAAGGAAPTAP